MGQSAMNSPLKRGALIAGGSALALFVFMFFDWFADSSQAADLAERARQAAEELGLDGRSEGSFAPESGWSGLGWLQIGLVISAIVLSLAFAVTTFAEQSPGSPVALSALLAGLGVITFLALLYALINPPGSETERELGLYLGLLATAGIVGGAYIGMQEEKATGPPSSSDPPPPSDPVAPGDRADTGRMPSERMRGSLVPDAFDRTSLWESGCVSWEGAGGGGMGPSPLVLTFSDPGRHPRPPPTTRVFRTTAPKCDRPPRESLERPAKPQR